MKNKINFIIDVFLFLIMMVIGGLGLLIKYVLVSGQERWAIYQKNVELYFLGMDRHEWGSIHLILGYILLALLALHILLHWRQIRLMFRQLISYRIWRLILTGSFVVASIVFFFFAFAIPIDVKTIQSGKGNRQVIHSLNENMAEEHVVVADQQKTTVVQHESAHQKDIKVYGFWTLAQVNEKYHVDLEKLKKELAIPSSVSNFEQLGRLRRKYGFSMGDVEKYIVEK